ncbi:MAG TPA: pitrilysin family protein, partial [Caulifigura sp.]|nr:pitrilysin family protein [Caulifigura sp.]
IGDYKGREAIAAGEAFDVSPNNIESRTTRGKLGSGLKTALLPKKTRGETVQLRLTLRYGSVESLSGLNTAAEALPTLMLRGTKQLSRQQIQDRLDDNKARISGSGSVGEASFTIEATRKTLPTVLDLLRQVLREPTLPVAELETIRNARLGSLSQQLTDPQALAQIAVQKALSPYPATDVRYAPSVAESVERWKSVERDQVVLLHHDFLGGEHGELSIVGDFDLEDTQVQLSKIFDGWSARQPFARIPRPGNLPIAGRVEKIETPDKDNAVYFAGEVMPMKDSDPDYPAFTIGNFVLGSSGLSSRLGDRVRQKEGLSYGVGSMFRANSLDERAVFSAYAITNPVNMPKVDTAIREETSKIISQGITGEELTAAQRSFLENQKVLRSEDANLAAILASTLEADRDMSFYTKLETQISQLTTDAVKSALQKRLSLDKLVVVMAGDFARVEKEAAASEGKK